MRLARVSVLASFGLGAALLCAALLCAHTAFGRRALADGIESLVSRNIPGRLAVGEITELGWRWVRARDVRFFHPDGRCVLHVKHALVEPGLSDVWRKQLTFRRVAADGGSMLLSVDPDGRLSFEATMSAPTTGHQGRGRRGLRYDLRNMHVDNLALRLDLLAAQSYQMSNVHGVVHVRNLDGAGTRVLLQNFAGAIAPEVAGAKLAARDIDGQVRGNSETVADVRATLAVDGESTLSIHVLYAPDKSQKLKVRVVDAQGAEATSLSWLMHAAAGFSADISVEG